MSVPVPFESADLAAYWGASTVISWRGGFAALLATGGTPNDGPELRLIGRLAGSRRRDQIHSIPAPADVLARGYRARRTFLGGHRVVQYDPPGPIDDWPHAPKLRLERGNTTEKQDGHDLRLRRG